MKFYKAIRKIIIALIFLIPSIAGAQAYTASEFSTTPVLISNAVDPFVMLSLSVELTQQAEAYTDGEQTYVQNGTYCPGRPSSDVGICYSHQETYIGYFDSEKCYDYTKGTNADAKPSYTSPDTVGTLDPPHFYPVGDAKDHKCANKFSGNFMNWATMTALDEFRSAMMGGARLVDTKGASAETLLTRAYRSSWRFVKKKISSSGHTKDGITFTNLPKDVTPFDVSSLRIDNDGAGENKVQFFDDSSTPEKLQKYGDVSSFYVVVKVCDPKLGLESNCEEYTDGTDTWYKPEGVMQKNALNMRFALMTYSAKTGNDIDGGVLRANAKYIGYYRKAASGGIEVNPDREIDEFGRLIFDPDNLADSANGVINSGILNYISSFGLGKNGYKGNDPIAELFYESLRYIKNLGNTPSFSSGLTNDEKDGFPVITGAGTAKDPAWIDPITEACQLTYNMYVGDQFGHEDYTIPGTSLPSKGPVDPSPTDADIEVDSLTDTVGKLENFYADHLGGKRLVDTAGAFTNVSYYIAGLSYYANTHDIRSDRDGPQYVKTFIVDTQEYKNNPPKRHVNPLWLAAKYGGFEDLNGDNDPTDGTGGTAEGVAGNVEWDNDGDSHPDNYTLASQPANLVKGLNDAFADMTDMVVAGSAAGVVSDTVAGQGMVVQGLYKPSQTDSAGSAFEWGGIVHSLFIDEFDNLREDTDGDGFLTNADTVIEFSTDPVTKVTSVTRYSTSDGGETKTAITGANAKAVIEEIQPIWNARTELSKLDNSSGQMRVQRTYSSAVASSNPSRYIFTAVDANKDGVVVPAAGTGMDYTMDFVDGKFPAYGSGAASDIENNFRLLGLDSSNGTKGPDIVNYIRGEAVSGYRSRTIDFDGDGTKDNWILGDIVSSSPIVVGKSSGIDRYDIVYRDRSYFDFYDKYQDRRNMVYTGANDGMLHAFNAGFVDRANKGFKKQVSGETAHPLGAEMWAYVPYNLLPHLKWLTESSYPHVAYVDGRPQVFDVNIFPKDTTHPEGWGTILVVGMRFGGGEYNLDPDSDADADLTDDITMRSAYIIFDVTDPESPPQLIAEISHPLMGYTLSAPAIVKAREHKSGTGTYVGLGAGDDAWYLVMGSGPYGSNPTTKTNALSAATSDQKAKVFLFDLQKKQFVTFASGDTYLEVPDDFSGFTGDFLVMDWDKDYIDDAIYFGTVTNTIADPKGDLWRLPLGSSVSGLITGLSNSSFKRVVADNGNSLALPVYGKPYAHKYRGKHWVTFGTGRFIVEEDAYVKKQNNYYGIKEPLDSNGDFTWAALDVGKNELVNTTDIEPQYLLNTDDPWDGYVQDKHSGSKTITLNIGETVSNYVEFREAVYKNEPGGWYYAFKDPKAKLSGGTVGLGSTLIFSEYWPGSNSCDLAGTSYINQLYLGTGHAAPFFELNLKYANGYAGGDDIQDRWIAIVDGFVPPPPPPGPEVIIQSNRGEILPPFEPDTAKYKTGVLSWREIPIKW